MPHGSPDYGEYAIMETIDRIIDLGELAVRLGSISHFNRSGNVIFQDDFEHTPLKWKFSGAALGSSAAYTDDTAYSGGQCVKLTTGDDEGDYAWLYKYFGMLNWGMLGVEIAYQIEDEEVYFILGIQQNNTVGAFPAVIRIDVENETLEVDDRTDEWVVVASDVVLQKQDYLFNHIKLIADFDTSKYVAIVINNREIDLSDYTIPTGAPSEFNFVAAHLGVQTKEDAAKVGYVDNFIMTQNEV